MIHKLDLAKMNIDYFEKNKIRLPTYTDSQYDGKRFPELIINK
jgi:hypothetical protein